jgi:hypothetical protein
LSRIFGGIASLLPKTEQPTPLTIPLIHALPNPRALIDKVYGKQAEERFRRAGTRLKTVEQGAATSVLLATSPLLDGVGGRYFEDCNEATVVHHRSETTIAGVASYALDAANAERLWELSLKLIQ